MTRLLDYSFNNWLFPTLKNWPKLYQICQRKLKMFSNTKWTLSKWPKFLTLCQSGKILPNLVTLHASNYLPNLFGSNVKDFLFRRFSGERQDFGARKADPEKASGGSFKRGKRRRRRRRRSAARNCDRILKHFLRKNKTKKIAISFIAKVCRRERSLLKKNWCYKKSC